MRAFSCRYLNFTSKAMFFGQLLSTNLTKSERQVANPTLILESVVFVAKVPTSKKFVTLKKCIFFSQGMRNIFVWDGVCKCSIENFNQSCPVDLLIYKSTQWEILDTKYTINCNQKLASFSI